MPGPYILLYGSQKIAKQPVLRLGSTGCCYVLFNPFSINSGSLFIQLDQIQQNLDALIHLLGGDALAGAVEVEAAGAEVRAGQALPGDTADGKKTTIQT